MRFALAMIAVLALAPAVGTQQPPTPSLPIGAGRPDVQGITRTILKDDAKVAVTRVRFDPGAGEQPHTHPTDIMIVPVVSGAVEFMMAPSTKLTSLKAGEVQFVPKEVIHYVKNTGTQPFELIAVTIK
jgi:quercetin dioxygenase-like cupin family protein